MFYVLVSLLWSLANANVGTFPYITFVGQTLPNNSYISFSRLELGGFNNGNGIICHTDASHCCSSNIAKWMFPNGSDVEQDGVLESIKLNKRVELQRGTASGNIPSGVYQCYITVFSGGTATTGTANVGLYDHTEGKCQSDGHDLCHCMSKTHIKIVTGI